MENLNVQNVWISENNFENTDLDKKKCPDWKKYKELREGNDTKPKTLSVLEGNSASFYSEDSIKILSPTEELIKLAEEKNNKNIMSTVLLIEHRGHKIVLGGDAEKDTWDYILENYSDEIKDISILKASHHGRESGYHQEALKQMNPKYTIVSVGEKPEQDASNKYKNYTRDKIYSTRWYGDISVEINKEKKIIIETQYQ
jgi:beta-lactamase superfamily II metal-dependent hydrolase